MTAWLLALLIQSAQAQTTTTVADYPTHYLVTTGYLNGSVAPNTTAVPSHFPTTSHKLSRGFSAGHTGMDIDAATGNAVLAWQTGVVEVVTTTGPYGNKVILRHDDSTTSLYAHLDTITVQPGQVLQSGDQLGTVGTTGYATGSHLHFEIRLHDQAVDPWPYVETAR